MPDWNAVMIDFFETPHALDWIEGTAVLSSINFAEFK